MNIKKFEKMVRRRAAGRICGRRTLKVVLLGLVAVQLLLIGFYFSVQPPLFDDPYSMVLLDRRGRLLGAAVATDQQWRFPSLAKVPEKFVRALICAEDRRFYRHPGIDPLAAGRALWQNLRAGRVVSGASTLTMQVIRLSRKGRPRTLGEKALEAVMALRLETLVDKPRILALYATHAPFGGNVVGLPAAAWRYFGRPPEDLSWGEAAFLAVLPNSPAMVHPGKNRRLLRQRRDRLLARLQEEGAIDALGARLARAEPLPQAPRAIPMLAPHLLFKTRANCDPGRGAVRTTLDKATQIRANQIVRRHLGDLAQNGIYNAGALILNVPSGQVRAYVGNHPDLSGHGHEEHVDVVRAPRSTGSILKPLLYAGMLEAGELLPTRLVADIPTRMGGFRPENYSRQYQGAVPAWMALARSLNIPSVRMLQSYGVDRFCALLKDLGMTTLHRPADQYGLTLILGGAEGTLWELTGIYAGLARSVDTAAAGRLDAAGFFPPRYLAAGPIPAPASNSVAGRPLSPASAWLTLQAMLQVTRPGVDSAWRQFSSARPIAWKTGTSYGFRDAWAIGVTPDFAVGVWVGNADGEGRPGLVGSQAAAPLMFDLFDILPPGDWFQRPEQGLTQIEVCSHSGYLAGPHCAQQKTVWMTTRGPGTVPCPYCRSVHTDETGRFQVHDGCQPLAQARLENWFVLPPAMAWYYRRHHADYLPLPPWREDCRRSMDSAGGAVLSMIYPQPNSRVYLPVELDGRRQQVVFEAAHSRPGKQVYWHLDGNYLGVTRDIHTMSLSAAPGVHTVTLVDEDGEELVRSFEVLFKAARASR
jgi:penicillin-binding protein 1C